MVAALHGISTVPPSDRGGAGPTVAVMPPAPAIAPAPPPPAAPRLADRRAMAAGARAMSPWLVGMGLYGLVVGVSAGRAHYLGAALALWVTWVGAVGVGTLAAGRLPDALALEFVIPLFLAAEVQRRPATRATRRAVVVAAAVAVAGAAVLPQLALLAAIVAAPATALATREAPR